MANLVSGNDSSVFFSKKAHLNSDKGLRASTEKKIIGFTDRKSLFQSKQFTSPLDNILNKLSGLFGSDDKTTKVATTTKTATTTKEVKKVGCTRYNGKYGPRYTGNKPLSSYSGWSDLISSGAITTNEKKILIAMSPNEGNLDTIQAYDNQIFTAGAMQKTIRRDGAGELPIQMNKFKERHPDLFQKYFKSNGWDVKKVSGKYKAYYKNKTGKALNTLIHKGFDASHYGKQVKSPASTSFIKAISSPEYQDLQVEDFVDRLRNVALKIKPTGFYQISKYVKSNLSKATVLDHHINRPGYVKKDFGNALKHFFKNNPSVSKNPADWGKKHAKYEKTIIEYYGKHRRGTDMVNRYNKMKPQL